jgi:hypothetical protein
LGQLDRTAKARNGVGSQIIMVFVPMLKMVGEGSQSFRGMGYDEQNRLLTEKQQQALN